MNKISPFSIIILLLFSIILNSCEEEVEKYEKSPSFIWQNIFNNWGIEVYDATSMCISDNNLVLITYDGQFGISVLNTTTGDENPIWENGINFSEDLFGLSMGGINMDVIVLSTTSGIKAYSLSTKQLLWENDFKLHNNRKAYCFDNYIFIQKNVSSSPPYYSDSCQIFILNANTGNLEKILKSNNSGVFYPKAYKDGNGNIIVAYQEKTGVNVYNLTNDSLLFYAEYTSGYEYSTVNGLGDGAYMHNGDYYYRDLYHLYKLDIGLQEFTDIWQVNEFDDILFEDNFLFIHNKNNPSHTFIAYNLITNNRQFLFSYNGQSSISNRNQMAYYNGLFYFMGQDMSFNCVDVNSGNILWTSQASLNTTGESINYMLQAIVDKENGVLFAHDYNKLYAIDLNNSPKTEIIE